MADVQTDLTALRDDLLALLPKHLYPGAGYVMDAWKFKLIADQLTAALRSLHVPDTEEAAKHRAEIRNALKTGFFEGVGAMRMNVSPERLWEDSSLSVLIEELRKEISWLRQDYVVVQPLVEIADRLTGLLGSLPPQEKEDRLRDLVKEASEIMQITYAGNFPAGIESFLVRASKEIAK